MHNGSFLVFGFAGTSPSGKTKEWNVQTKTGISLGIIKFHAPWRKYWFEPASETGFDGACMAEIATFVKDATAEWRKGLK